MTDEAARVLLSAVIDAVSTSVGEVEQLAGGPVLTIPDAEALVDRVVGTIAAFLSERAKARVAFQAVGAGDTVH